MSHSSLAADKKSARAKQFNPFLTKPKTRDEGRAWAREYIKRLREAPESVALDGLLTDVAGTDYEAPIVGFCDELQKLMVESLSRQPVRNKSRGASSFSADYLLDELMERKEQAYAIALAIHQQLQPTSDTEDSIDYTAYYLAVTLIDMLGDQQLETDLRTAIANGAAAESGARHA